MENTKEITLELYPTEPTPEVGEAVVPVEAVPEEEFVYLEQTGLNEAELQMVADFAEKIDLHDSGIILAYGAAAQKKIASFSENALEGVRTKDLGEVSGMIVTLVGELKTFDARPEKKGLFSFFKKAADPITQLKARYDEVEDNIDKIVGILEGHQNQLTKDIILLDKLYESNLLYFKELTMYILAGKKRLEAERATTLPAMKAKAEERGLAEDAQAYNDYAALCDRFEKKIHDLELTRTVSIQMAPQIRLIQNSNTLLVEKIQSTILNTIPLWKNQMLLALGIHHTRQAVQAQREVNDLTNELLKKNADTLRMGTTEIARENERSIVDIETIRHTNEQLIATLDDVLRIQEEGRQKRQAAEAELGKIEGQLREKLLEIR